ncbi:maltase 1-like isoform X1 [Biomphalaria glabrata]|uniref:Maltase 1-like isoform X1 n=1 Tax=Biomphalaria glabrata TaxID=6526 RepID=A0A9W3B6B0_BIOGL|nr:maltase 1-like isoform X1 [Biomphalaria glabrata]
MIRLCCLVLLALSGCSCFLFDDPDPVETLPWWKTTIIYQVYPRSFKDSDGDGVGDIQGIISQLNYFKYLGVETLWISPFYKSPQRDFGYDISDARDVDPLFGNISDFRRLVDEAKKLGLRILMDFVPNHTSDQHDWFQKSLRKEGKYTDFYVWADGKLLDNGTLIRPNNWLGIFGGTVWTWVPERQQYYLHQFTPYQPDLNFRNPDVREEVMLTMRYWLDQGIDGLRMDAIANLYEDEQLRDNPLSGQPVPSDDWNYLIAKYTNYLQPEVPQEIVRWQSVFDSMTKVDGKERFMVLEFYTDSDTRSKMAEFGAHPFNMDLVDSLTVPLNASQIMGLVSQEYTNKPASYWPTFVVGNHDRKRIASKYGRYTVNAFNMLLMTLKGTPTTYYGEEIGMEDISLTYQESQDPWAINAGPDRYLLVSRDVNRSPMQWSDSPQAGFTTGNKTWLPIQANYTSLNVEIEKVQARSHLNLYKEYASLRQLKAFKYGHINVNMVTNDNVLSYLRYFSTDRYLVAINFGQSESTDDYSLHLVNTNSGVVVSDTGNVDAAIAKGSTVDLQKLTLKPGNGVVVKLN